MPVAQVPTVPILLTHDKHCCRTLKIAVPPDSQLEVCPENFNSAAAPVKMAVSLWSNSGKYHSTS